VTNPDPDHLCRVILPGREDALPGAVDVAILLGSGKPGGNVLVTTCKGCEKEKEVWLRCWLWGKPLPLR
jgi:hypothetical protein